MSAETWGIQVCVGNKDATRFNSALSSTTFYIVCARQLKGGKHLDYFPDMDVSPWSYLYFNSYVPIAFKIEVYINTHEAKISSY